MHRNKQNFFWNQQAFFDTYWRQPWRSKKQLLVDNINIAATDLDHLCQQEAVTTRMLTQQNNTFSLRSPKWDVNDPSKRTLFIQEMDRWFQKYVIFTSIFLIILGGDLMTSWEATVQREVVLPHMLISMMFLFCK
ncbi:MAG: hypothetical protein R3A45_03610 [Bdellovibrionota bacterium]